MKIKLSLIIFLIFCVPNVQASSINAAAYRTMQANSYRNNYNRQVFNRNMPYWQAQSNYATRNRMYTNYANYTNYTNYTNSVNQFNYNTRMYRGR